MLTRTMTGVASIALGVSVFVSTEARAAAQRTFVASTGNDTHACTLTQPCRSFGAAIAKTNAGGEVLVLDSAGYGAATVDKSVSILAPSGVYAGISVFAGDGVAIAAPGATVVLRGLSINGQGGATGIHIQQAAAVRIEGCVVSGMSSTGIADNAAGADVALFDTIVRDNGNSGIEILTSSGSVHVDRVRSERNAGSGLIASSSGTALTISISDSTFVHNANGVAVTGGGGGTTYIALERSILSDNTFDGFFSDGSGPAGARIEAMLSRNTAHRNGGNGITIGATSPGVAVGHAFENATFGNAGGMWGLVIDGNGASATISANSGQFARCMNGATIESFGNNSVLNIGIASCATQNPLSTH